MTDHVFYRALRPEWSFAPLSGEGAKKNGGRWNPKGQAALYLAGDPMTAIAEYNQDFYFRPVTLVEYQVRNTRLADLSDPLFRKTHDIHDDDLAIAWRAEALSGKTPRSWNIAAALMADGYHGALFLSRINQAPSLVLWRWNDESGCTVEVQDFDQRLPRDSTSWRP